MAICVVDYLLIFDMGMTEFWLLALQIPSHALMGIPGESEPMPLSPLGEACLRMDFTAIHEFLEKLGYKDDEGAATEVCLFITTFLHPFLLLLTYCLCL